MRFVSNISLRGLLISVVFVLFLPALIFGILGYLKVRAQEEDLGQVRLQINEINRTINESVTSPFYMSPRIFDPCSPESLDLITYPDNWNVTSQASYDWGIVCEWVYFREGDMLAVDKWNEYDRKLGSRVYYQNGTDILATDTFFVMNDSGRVMCVKQRQYESPNVTECYSEAGILISIDPTDNLFSPLPPMLYWFSYR